MLGIALTVAVVIGLGASSWLLASCLRHASLAPFLLTVYLLGWAQLVLAALVLSAVRSFGRTGLVIAALAWLALAIAVWNARGRPSWPAVRPPLRWALGELRSPALGILAATVGAAYAYLVVLGIVVPQNDGDPLVYQLARAALWVQDGAIGIVGSAIEPRLDVNPIVAEVGQAATLALAGSERLVWLGQLTAVAACSLGAFALARRVGLSARAGLTSALVVPTLPVVVTQATTAYNDLVLASFVVAALVFALGRTRSELIGLALAAALAVGTKFTAAFVLPIAALVALLGHPWRQALVRIAAIGTGAALGSGWIVVNLVRTGDPDGGLAEFASQVPSRDVESTAYAVQRLLLDAIELPGSTGGGEDLYVLTGITVVLVGLVLLFVRPGTGVPVALAGLALFVTPTLIPRLHTWVAFGFAKVWSQLDRADTARALRLKSVELRADGVASWFGPLALVMGCGVMVVAIRRVRRGTLDRAALGLAVAPGLAIASIALGVTYDPWRGRFLIAAAVASVALWGIAFERRATALALSFVAATTLALSTLQYYGRPSGMPNLSSPRGPVWQLERWEAQTQLRRFTQREQGEVAVIRFVERSVDPRAPIATSLWGNDFLFPYFGERLERRVTLLDPEDRVPKDARWLVAAPEVAVTGCSESWRRRIDHVSGWRVLERTAPDACASTAVLGAAA
jgi:4-amino-4-deoxy-L-arabinose transferase-like glycosyltransferase